MQEFLVPVSSYLLLPTVSGFNANKLTLFFLLSNRAAEARNRIRIMRLRYEANRVRILLLFISNCLCVNGLTHEAFAFYMYCDSLLADAQFCYNFPSCKFGISDSINNNKAEKTSSVNVQLFGRLRRKRIFLKQS